MQAAAGAIFLYAWGLAAFAYAGVPAQRPSFDELVDIVRTGNAYQRAEAISPLSRIDDPRVVPELVVLLADEDVTVRTNAARQLARLGDKRSADALAQALADRSEEVGRYAAEGLGKVGEKRHVPALVAAVMSHLPDPNQRIYRPWYPAVLLETTGKVATKAPGQLIALVERACDEGCRSKREDWWRVLEAVARCLGQIGDEAASAPLQRAQAILEAGHQDYRAWYAVRKARAAVELEAASFARPAADILNEVWWGKGAPDSSIPLAQLGDQALEDLAWVLRFECEQDQERVVTALRALGEIGGNAVARILRQYIEAQCTRPEAAEEPVQGYLARAFGALLQATPDEQTARDIFITAHRLNDSQQHSLVGAILVSSADQIPADVQMIFGEYAALGSAQGGPLGRDAINCVASRLGWMGGQRAGEILRKLLLESADADRATIVVEALGNIRDYDAIPVLIEASRLAYTPKDVVAHAMGVIRDQRAVPALRDMMRQGGLTGEDRLWAAAALARLGADYPENAGIVREALPESMHQAGWLYDKETVEAVAGFLGVKERVDRRHLRMSRGRPPRIWGPPMSAGETVSDQAVRTLMAIGNAAAFAALTAHINLETVDDLHYFYRLTDAAASMAERLGHPSREYWVRVRSVARGVVELFTVRLAQQAPGRSTWARRDYSEVLKENPALTRKMWMAEVTRHLNEEAKIAAGEISITAAAVLVTQRVFDPELIPHLERLARECRATRSVRGKYGIIKHYYIRSLAAQVLTEKTGRPYAYVEADGQTRPGGWDPSREDL